MLGTSRVEPLLRAIRNGMTGAGLYVESAKGECNLGQHEIVFRYRDALGACDEHSIYKSGAKEIAAHQGMSLTFMAKYDAAEGNSCHIHLSLRRDDEPVMPGDGPQGFSTLMGHFLAGSTGLHGGADVLPRAEHQLLQAVRGRQLRPHGPGLGPRQPHVRPAGRRARGVAAVREPGPRW